MSFHTATGTAQNTCGLPESALPLCTGYAPVPIGTGVLFPLPQTPGTGILTPAEAFQSAVHPVCGRLLSPHVSAEDRSGSEPANPNRFLDTVHVSGQFSHA